MSMTDEFDIDDGTDTSFIDPDLENQDETELIESQQYGRTWQFDTGTRRMVRYGNRPTEITGIDNLRQWIDITMNVASGAHPIFPEDYGIDEPNLLIGETFSPALEAEYEDQIITALTFHDRIVSVTDFEFTHSEAEQVVYYSFVVHTDDEEEDPLKITAEIGN